MMNASKIDAVIGFIILNLAMSWCPSLSLRWKQNHEVKKEYIKLSLKDILLSS